MDLKNTKFETLLELYQEYRESNIWEPPSEFKDTFAYVQYGMSLKHELQRRDKRRSVIL